MKRYFESWWIAPVLTAACAIAAFASVELRLFPAPYYLGMALPVVLTGNLVVLVRQLVGRQWKVPAKTTALTCVAAAFCFFWFIQTA